MSSASYFVESWNLSPEIAKNLASEGIIDLFPVQKSVIPTLLRLTAQRSIHPRDLCVSAPTGSGKTLAYAIPIIQSLLTRPIVALHSIILLPSRELATQVYKVFVQLARGLDIRILCSTGHSSLESEQAFLFGGSYTDCNTMNFTTKLFSNNVVNGSTHDSSRENSFGADIIVCTPGRLLEHIQKTVGFSLSNLRFLVLDEADRLLGNAYHHWVRALLQPLNNISTGSLGSSFPLSQEARYQSNASLTLSSGWNIHMATPTSVGAIQKYCLPEQAVQKLLFSATLSDNPRKLALLGIRNPIIIRANAMSTTPAATPATILPHTKSNSLVSQAASADSKMKNSGTFSSFMLPQTLTEALCICETARRPFILSVLVAEALGMVSANAGSTQHHRGCCSAPNTMVLIFSSSVETTRRLSKLLQLMNDPSSDSTSSPPDTNKGIAGSYLFGGRVAEMSSRLHAEERNEIMQAAAAGDIRVLISSDHMARGIDLPNIRLVVNYDPPTHAKTYVHRAGRTARANRSGHCITLLKIGQVGGFRKLRQTISSGGGSGGGGVDAEVDSKLGWVPTKCRPSKEGELLLNEPYRHALKLLSKSE